MTTRFLMGVAEAGVFPGCESILQSILVLGKLADMGEKGFYLIGMWYKGWEAQKRFSFFFNAASMAAAFGGLLASAIGKMDGIRGYSAWRWIFILEGILTCVLAAVAYFMITDFPEEARWLTEDERAFIVKKLAADQGSSGLEARITWRSVVETFSDWKMIPGALMYFGPAVSAYGEYLPAAIMISKCLISSNLSQTNRTCLLYSIHRFDIWLHSHSSPASLCGSMGRRRGTLPVGRVPVGQDQIPLLLHHLWSVPGPLRQPCAIYRPRQSPSSICCCIPVPDGGHQHVARRGLLVHHESEGTSEPGRGTAWQVGFGNCAGIIATFAFPSADAPRYRLGYSLGLGFLCLAGAAALAYFVGCLMANKRRGGTDRFIL